MVAVVPEITIGSIGATLSSSGRKVGSMTNLIRQRLPAVAGILYSSAGFVLLMGIITAETKYPVFRHYTTRQEIGDLGGTRPPHGLVTQPSAMIFDTTMLIAGCCC
jgi:hypothetical protein